MLCGLSSPLEIVMSISHVILGFLNQKPMSGYTIKKQIVDAPFFHSSGNNNQIYKALLDLHHKGFAEVKVEQKDKGASSKVYSITLAGRLELQAWVSSLPQPSEFYSSFHQQLAFASVLNERQIEELFLAYEEETRTQIAAAKELHKRFVSLEANTPNPRDMSLRHHCWESILQHRVQIYELELRWLERTRQSLLAPKMTFAERKRGKK